MLRNWIKPCFGSAMVDKGAALKLLKVTGPVSIGWMA
jgi:hypothetical protein